MNPTEANQTTLLLPFPLPESLPSAGAYLLGYLVGLAAFIWMARRRRLATFGIWSVAGVALFGGLIGANIVQFAFGGVAGKTVLGGIAGGTLSILIYKRIIGLRRPTGDLFAVALCAGEAVGRWGCFFGGCCYGKPASGLWCAIYQHDMWRHPTQIYQSLAALVILIILVTLELRKTNRLPEDGLFCIQGLLYSAARFGIEFFRDGPPPHTGLTTGQWGCVLLFAFFVYRSVRLWRPAPVPLLTPRTEPTV